MSSGRVFAGIFDGLTDRILCVAGAVLFSQGPEFMQQYLQRLGGHLDEARRQVATFQRTAVDSGLTLERFISQTSANADPAVAKLAGVISASVERADALAAAHGALLHATLWERPFVFLRHLDSTIARSTAAVYQPAVPTTLEGLIYALLGMMLALALYHLGARRLLGLLLTRRRPVRAPA